GNGADQGRGYGSGRWYDFYQANLQRTYGKPCTADSVTAQQAPADTSPAPQATPCVAPAFDQKRWVGHTLDRLQAWGFNPIGNWSAPALGLADRVPYTLPLSIVGDYASISTGSD
ncbi:hypothetical protein SB758_32695, partial [Burkholderia sp. SIMBA_013]